jgi:hypothetical protein
VRTSSGWRSRKEVEDRMPDGRPTHHRNHYVRDVSANEDRIRIRHNPGIPARAPPMGALALPIRLKTYE